MIKYYLIIFITLIFRLITINNFNLVDPTETRYAVIAQNMVLTNNWITPQLPCENIKDICQDGLMPYLGKPPMHFWLTALSFKVFGFNSFAARFPSYLGIVFCTLFLYLIGIQKSKKFALDLSLIFLSSALFLILSATSTTDITLAVFYFISGYFLININKNKLNNDYFFLFFTLAFLTKGPVIFGFYLIAFILSKIRKEVINFKELNYFRGIIIFGLLTIPWFIISEIKNPGFIKYFIINENLKRYLVRDYGDMYGSGHYYFYGTIWFFLILSVIPWSLLFLFRIKNLKEDFAKNDKLILVLAFSPIIFFTFVKQLHAAYVLPAIPFISIFICNYVQDLNIDKLIDKIYPYLLSLLFIIITYGSYYYLQADLTMILVFILITILVFCIKFDNFIQKISVLVIYSLLSTNYLASNHINNKFSVSNLIKDYNFEDNSELAVINFNNYSAFWSLYNKKLQIKISNPSEIIKNKTKYVLVRRNQKNQLNQDFYLKYNLITDNSFWFLYKKISIKKN